MPKVTIIEPTLHGPGGYGEDGNRRNSGEGAEGDTQPKLRVAAYARVSTEQDEQQSSYEAQVSYYTTYIKSNSQWEFVGVFADEGISGTDTRKRDGFNQMVEAALGGKIDIILTKSISRFVLLEGKPLHFRVYGREVALREMGETHVEKVPRDLL